MTSRICAVLRCTASEGLAVRSAVLEALTQAPLEWAGVSAAHAGWHLPGSVGEGELTWDLSVTSDEAVKEVVQKLRRDLATACFAKDAKLAAEVHCVYAARVVPIEDKVDEAAPVAIKRTNFVRVLDGAPPATVAQWLRELPLMAHHIPAIRSWCLSRVEVLLSSENSPPWTHLWEQEFSSAEGLNHDYMAHPLHWGRIDAWYDPEQPRCIVDARLAHLYCEARESVLSWPIEAPGGDANVDPK